MKRIVILLFAFVVLCCLEIQGKKKYQEVLDKMKEMALSGETINDVLNPSKDGHLGGGFYGVIFKGTLISHEKEVAMKFTTTAHKYCIDAAKNEYEMYSYLNAINNSAIEMYGIPSVYYYGQWNGYILMAITLLDSDSMMKNSFKSNEINELDVLIIFQEFVRISKYIHSRGIFHNDIKLNNILFRRNQGFIIDYNIAKRLNRHAKKDERRYMKRDWERFFYAICNAMDGEIDWIGSGSKVADNLEIFENIKSDALRRVFIEFVKNICVDKGSESSITILHYDRLYEIISHEIKQINPSEMPLVSWLKNEDKTKAIQKLTEIPNIFLINDPFGLVEPEYSEVNFNYFHKQDLF